MAINQESFLFELKWIINRVSNIGKAAQIFLKN